MRLIDADLVKLMLMHRARLVHYGFEDRLCVPYNAVDEVPTLGDAVLVVRCMDCKYYDSYYTSCNHQRHDHQEFRVVQEPDDYCSYGERRSE